jgi:hypothetical protein
LGNEQEGILVVSVDSEVAASQECTLQARRLCNGGDTMDLGIKGKVALVLVTQGCGIPYAMKQEF